MNKYYLYILECRNNSYYIGYTTDVARRWLEHLQGSPKCKYTRSFLPKRIVVCWQISATLSSVLSLESRLKRLSRMQKIVLVQQPKKLQAILKKYLLLDISFKVINDLEAFQDKT